MPPLIVEASLALALGASLIRLTTVVNRIEAKHDRLHVELIGKHEVIKIELDQLKNGYSELKTEIKESRHNRFTDTK